MSYDLNFRIATTEAGLLKGALLAYGIPYPDLPIYQDYSARVDQSDGGQALRGFSYVTWQWDLLTLDQARVIRRLAETALDAGTPLYLTIDTGWNGSTSLGRWIDVSGTPVVPVINPEAGKRARVCRDVVLRVVDLTVENDPASGSL
jgi:hypothetical protein